MSAGLALAQSGDPSRYFYAIEDLTTGAILRRGYATDRGIPGNELILAPNAPFRAWLYHAATGRLGEREFGTPDSGQRFTIPPIPMGVPLAPDSDGDGLSDDAEFVLGTEGLKADSDGDGIPDGVEVAQGQNPLDGQPVITGILASAPVTGSAVDVCALDGLAAVAAGSAGVALFNIEDPMQPVRITQLNTPGAALAVACGGAFVAVADGTEGLVVIGRDGSGAYRIRHQVDFGGEVQVVETDGNVVYAGLRDGRLFVVDPISGLVLNEIQVPGAVQDLALTSQRLHVLTGTELLIYDPADDLEVLLGRLDVPGGTPFFEIGRKLFVGGGYAYVGHVIGFSIVDVDDPAAMQLVGSPPRTQPVVHHLAATGSGQLLAVTSFEGAGSYQVSVYDVTNPAVVTNLVTSFETPGDCEAVAIVDGLAYVADGDAGLQILNYLAYDSRGKPPVAEVDPSFPVDPLRATSGDLASVAVRVTDDVQVRRVEFYLDGALLGTDASFPFERSIIVPSLGARRASFTFRARAIDTGGNETWTPETTVALVPDSTPPRLRRFTPSEGELVDTRDSFFAVFSEVMDPASLGPDTLRLTWAGPDHQLETPDDARITNATVTLRAIAQAAVFTAERPLANGRYRVTATPQLRDAAGNPLTNEVSATFWVLRGGPLGDADSDGIFNTNEVAAGFNPILGDTDGDGWTDSVELAEDEAYVIDPRLRPGRTFAAQPSARVRLPGVEELGLVGASIAVSRPSTWVKLPGVEELGLVGVATTVAEPPVRLRVPGREELGLVGAGPTVAIPPVSVRLPGPEETGAVGRAAIVARPPVQVTFPTEGGTP